MIKSGQELFDRIPTGFKNAMYVDNNNFSFRNMVKKANCDGDVIINIGTGYFRPDLNDDIEIEMVNDYLNKERSRAMSTLYKLGKMQSSLNRKRPMHRMNDLLNDYLREERKYGFIKDTE